MLTKIFTRRLGSRHPAAGVAAALLACVVLNLIVLVYQLRTLVRREPSYSASCHRFSLSLALVAHDADPVAYIGDDRPRELPIKVRPVSMVFHDDPVRYRMSGLQAWAEWASLRPPGAGYVYLGQSYFSFGVSMWHQLHCLDHLRTVLVLGDDGSDHTEHCFHYLRQGILCAADTTLEPGGPSMRVPGGGLGQIATGVNVTHTCRDWRQVYDWMAEQHATWTPEMQQRLNEPSDGHGGRIGKGGIE